ncbi:MAG: hypothetical protein MMC23_008473 [Stictis urceolatum]|nr:hypothetical protein [Stictis urceolata]
MGWFSSDPHPPPPAKTSDGAYIAPGRSARDKCWAARDAFFACLDQNGIVDSITNKDEAAAKCGQQDEDLKRECASSWVSYFKQRRVMENKKKTILEGLEKEGAQPLGQDVSGMRPGGPPK